MSFWQGCALAFAWWLGFAQVRAEQLNNPMNDIYPTVTLSNRQLELTIYLPDARNGYYRGPRFDWSGMIGRAMYKGHTFFGAWKSPHDPTDMESGIGTAEEFGIGACDMPGPLGYADAKVGETFVKIGVGWLQKVEEPYYRFGEQYQIVRPGQWKVNTGTDWIEFQQTIKDDRGWGYFYTKRISLVHDQPEFVVSHTLRNTGRKAIVTSHYCHNLTMIDDTPVGMSYKVEFPFVPKPKRDLRGIAEAKGNEMIFLRDLANGEALFTELGGFGSGAADNQATILNQRTGTSLQIRGDQPVLQFHFFATKTVVCPEMYVKINLPPGQAMTWKNTYQLRVPSNLGKP